MKTKCNKIKFFSSTSAKYFLKQKLEKCSQIFVVQVDMSQLKKKTTRKRRYFRFIGSHLTLFSRFFFLFFFFGLREGQSGKSTICQGPWLNRWRPRTERRKLLFNHLRLFLPPSSHILLRLNFSPPTMPCRWLRSSDRKKMRKSPNDLVSYSFNKLFGIFSVAYTFLLA